MLSHNLPIKIEPQQNEAYNTKFKTNIVWKQLFHNPHIVDASYWSVNATFGTKTVADNKMTYTITTKNANQAITQPNIAFTQNHIYLLSCWLTVSEDQVVGIYTGNAVTNIANVKANVRTRIFNVFKSNVTSTRTCYIYPARNGGLPIGGTVVVEDGCLYDLTEMFGEGKEMLGRFSFLSNFPNNYYDYNVDGDSVPFTIPVYGGSLNVITGALTIDRYNVDLGYLFWQYSAAQASSGKYRKACTEALFAPVSTTSTVPDLISSEYAAKSNDETYRCIEGVSISSTASGAMYIFDERYVDQDDMPAFANAVRGVTVCYKMYSPVTYQLTAQEVRTLLGYNKITSNATKLQFTYLNDNNETIALTGDNEYIIDDGVFNRSPSTVNQIFEPKQDLHGYDYPWPPGGGGNLMNIGDIELLKDPDLVHINSTRTGFYGTDEDLVEMFNGGEWGYIPILGQDTLNPVGIEYDTPYTLYFRAYTDAEESTSGTGLEVVFYEENGTRMSSMRLRNSYTSEREFSYTTFNPDRGEPGYTLGGIAIEGGSGLCGNTWHFEFMSLAEGTSYLPYSNICPIEGYTESVLTVEGDRISDSESERRLKTITRPAFQWDIGLKLKFEGCTFADGTLCQFDNKLTTFSQNEYIVNNECIIPASLLDENCQGDIVAYINVSGNNYDVVVYEVYIPVIKRPKPENFLRPAIDLPQAIVASFADGADDVPLEKLNLPLLPKQDLHGYDYPWVGGGGKNKADAGAFETGVLDGTTGNVAGKQNTTIASKGNGGVSWTSTSTWRGITSDYIPVKPSTSYYISLTETPSYVLYAWYQADKTFISRSSYSGSSPTAITAPANASYVRFTLNEATAGTYNYHNIQFEEGSSATAYAPYENICPITGYTEANVMRTGRNLFDLNYLSATDITIEDGVVSGTAAKFHANFGGNAGGIPIPNLPQGQLTLSFDIKTDGNVSTSGNGVVVRFHYTDGVWTGIMKTNNTTEYSHEVMVSNASKVVDYIYISYSTTSNNIWYFKNIQLELGSSATNYIPYAGHAYNIPFSFECQNIFTREGETDGKYLNSSGVLTNHSAFAVSDYLEIEPQKRYVIADRDHGTSTAVYHAWYDVNKAFIHSDQWNQESIISPSNAKYLRVSYRKTGAPTSIRIEVGVVPHGVVDVVTGVLSVDYAYISDLSYYNFSNSSDVLFYTYVLSGAYKPATNPERLTGIACASYKISSVALANLTTTPYSMLRIGGRLYFRNDDYSGNTVDFRQSMLGVQAIYELETPCTYQLTPTEVKSLLGYNNIWADTGEVEVSYYPDPYLHFES